MESPPPEHLGKPPAQCQRELRLLRVSRDGSRLRPAGPKCSTAASPLRLLHPTTPSGFGTESQPCQRLEGRELSPSLRARTPPLLSALPGSARPARPGADTSLGDRRCAETGRAGAGGCGRCRMLRLLSSPTGSGRRPCARGLPGKLRARSGGEGMSPELLPTFPPRPSFYHSISGPSHRDGPSFLLPSLRELDSLPPPASGYPAPSLHRPRPSVSVLAAEQGASAPQTPACISVRVPHPIPGCLQRPGVLVLCRGGKEGWLSSRWCILQLLPCLSSGVCVLGEISATTASCKRGRVWESVLHPLF